jgi:hypothetical protein
MTDYEKGEAIGFVLCTIVIGFLAWLATEPLGAFHVRFAVAFIVTFIEADLRGIWRAVK